MTKVAIYSRKSKYTGKGDSIENQVEMCKSHVNTILGNDIEFLIYEDEGFSGGTIDRPQFKKMLKDAKDKKFSYLICYRLDRISRNVADFSTLAQKLQEWNIHFISIREQFDTTSPMGRAMMYISSVFAQLERETIAERVRDNMLEMAKNGRWTGGKIPIGFKSEKVVSIDGNNNKHESTMLVIDNDKMQFVKTLYEKYLELGSLHKLEVYMHENNIKSNNNIIFEKSTLKLILQNPIYVKSTPAVINYLTSSGWTIYGEPNGVNSLLTYNKTESTHKNGKVVKAKKDLGERFAAVSSIEGAFEESLWLDVQRQFQKNKDTFPRLGKTHNALLTGKLKCGYCKEYMLIQHGAKSKVTGEKLFYYVCSLKRKSRKKLCQNKNASASKIESAVLNALKTLGMKKSSYLESLRKINNATIKNNDVSNNKILIEKSITDKNKKMQNLLDKLSLSDDPDIDKIIMDKIKSFKNEISSLENEKANLIKSNNLANDDLLNINLISNLLDKCSNIDALSKDEQRQIINTIIDVIYWYGDDDKIKIKFYGISDNDDIDTICYDEPEQPSINRLFFSSHSMSSI